MCVKGGRNLERVHSDRKHVRIIVPYFCISMPTAFNLQKRQDAGAASTHSSLSLIGHDGKRFGDVQLLSALQKNHLSVVIMWYKTFNWFE